MLLPFLLPTIYNYVYYASIVRYIGAVLLCVYYVGHYYYNIIYHTVYNSHYAMVQYNGVLGSRKWLLENIAAMHRS